MRKSVGKRIVAAALCVCMLMGCGGEALAGAVLKLPSWVSEIEKEAFYGLQSVDEVVLPSQLEKIGSKAFANTSIKKINIPNNKELKIADDAFEGSNDLRFDCYEYGYAGQYARDHGIWPYGARIGMKQEPSNPCTGNVTVFTASAEADADFISDGVLQYEFVLRDNKKDIICTQKYHEDPSFRYTFKYAGDYTITISVAKKTESVYLKQMSSKTFPVHVEEAPLTWISSLANKTSALVGESITWSINTSGGLGDIPFQIAVVRDGVTEYVCDGLKDISSFSYTPLNQGRYRLDISATDETGALIEGMSNTVSVTPGEVTPWEDFECSFFTGRYVGYRADIIKYVGTDSHVVVPSVVYDEQGRAVEVWHISENAFTGNQNIVSVVIPEGCVDRYSQLNFDNCTNLESVVFPKGFNGNGTFSNCVSLKSVSPLSGNIGDFDGCTSLTSLVLPEGVTSVGNFNNCSNLKSLVLPSTLKSIGDLCGCSSLTSLVLPKGVTRIGKFKGCSSLATLVLPDGITHIGPENDRYYSYSGIFEDCSSLTTLVLPDSIEKYYLDYAFRGCSSLKSVVLPKKGLVQNKIQWGAFEGCRSLTSLVLPDGITVIGSSAFAGCSSLPSIELSDGLTTISSNAFSGCSSLSSVKLPDSLTTIDVSAFSDCTSLTSIELPDSLTTIGRFAFENCSSLKSIVLPKGLTAISGWTFSECENLEYAFIPSNITTIGDHVFNRCHNLTNVVLSQGVAEIGDNVFYECSKLDNVVLPESVTKIGQMAFSHCENLSSIVMPASLTSLGEIAFQLCKRLNSIVIPSGISTIEKQTFSLCESLTSIVIPDGVTSIGSWAFQSCYKLQSIVIPASVTFIDDTAFNNRTWRLTIYGEAGSYAEQYAKQQGISFSTQIPDLSASTLSGRVLTDDWIPLAGVTVSIYEADTVGQPLASLTTDQNGEWSWNGAKLSVGYHISYQMAGYSFSPNVQSVTGAQLDIVLPDVTATPIDEVEEDPPVIPLTPFTAYPGHTTWISTTTWGDDPTNIIPGDIISFLYPSDTVRVIGYCGNYYYVSHEEHGKGFVDASAFHTERKPWGRIAMTPVDSEGGYMYKPQITMLGMSYLADFYWDCLEMYVPSTVKVIVELENMATGWKTTIYTGNQRSCAYDTMDLPLGDYWLRVITMSTDGLITYGNTAVGNMVRVLSQEEYEELFGKEPDYYAMTLEKADWLLNLHYLFDGKGLYTLDGTLVCEALDPATISQNAVGKTYTVIFEGNWSEAYATIPVQAMILTETILAQYSNATGTFAVTSKFLKNIISLLGLPDDLIIPFMELVEQTRIGQEEPIYSISSADVKEMMKKAQMKDRTKVLKIIVETFAEVGQLAYTVSQIPMSQRAELEAIAISFQQSSDPLLKQAGEYLQMIAAPKTDDDLLNYFLATRWPSGVQTILNDGVLKEMLPSCIEKIFGKAKHFQTFKIYTTALKVGWRGGVMFNHVAFNLKEVTSCAFHWEWCVNAARAYRPTYERALENFRKDKRTYSEFVTAARTFSNLVTAEYEAYLDFYKALDTAPASGLVNFVKGKADYDEVAPNIRRLVGMTVCTLCLNCNHFYDHYGESENLTYVEWMPY